MKKQSPGLDGATLPSFWERDVSGIKCSKHVAIDNPISHRFGQLSQVGFLLSGLLVI